MKPPKIKVAEVRLEQPEINAVTNVLKSGILRESKATVQFEALMKELTGVKHAIAASSGTAALHLSYLSILRPGAEVIVPDFTFISTASMVVMAGAKPVFCDIDPKTWVLDPADVRRKITDKTRAIVGVNLFGNVCDLESLRKIADDRKLTLILDAAQSQGSRYNGKDPAAFADLTCFSFYPTKNMTTGEGGMVVTNNDELACKIRYLKSHGEVSKYTHSFLGFNYRMPELAAALGVVQMGRLDGFLTKRKQIAARYKGVFAKIPGLEVQQTTSNCDHAFNYFCLRLNSEKISLSRDEFISSLEKLGVPCAVHYPKTLDAQPCFAGLVSGSFEHARKLAEEIFALPIHPYLTEEAVDYIIQQVETLAGQTSHSA